MKNLIFSLIIVVIAAVMGLGWSISKVYQEVAISKTSTAKDTISGYTDMGINLARTIDSVGLSQQFLHTWSMQRELAISLKSLANFPLPHSVQQTLMSGQPLLLESESGLSSHFYMPNTNQVLSLQLPSHLSRQPDNRLNLGFTLAFYIGVAIILLAWLYPLIRHLLKLADTAQSFGKGHLESRVKISRWSYISPIENEFNAMADRIETLLSDNKMLSRAVSHDLKTPLARLRFGIDMIEDATDESARTRYIERINNDLTDMETLVSTLLNYARLDESYITQNHEPIDINTVIPEWVSHFNSADKLITFDFAEQNIVLNADHRYLAMQINNLVGNALQYATKTVVISAKISQHHIEVKVEDDGPGIDESELLDVVKPFQRGTNHLAQGGHGMGLAIVARIAKWQNAELALSRSEDLGGLSATLVFNTQKRLNTDKETEPF